MTTSAVNEFKLICVSDVNKKVSEEIIKIALRYHNSSWHPLNFLLVRNGKKVDVYANIGQVNAFYGINDESNYLVIRECCGCKNIIQEKGQ